MEAILKKEIILNKTLCRLIGVVIFIILTSLGAFVRVPLPFTPVPVTLQTFFVLLCGASLGSGWGAIAQLIYIFLGVAGISVFTGAGSGLLYLFGPTGGYLFGFVLSALFIGRFIRYTKANLFSLIGLFCIADLLILACGIAWLKFVFGYPWTKLLFIGFIPFLPGDLLKVIVATTLYLKLRIRLKEIFP